MKNSINSEIPQIFQNLQYDKIITFNNTNYTIAIQNGKAGLIDLEGNPLSEFIYDDLSDNYYNCEDERWSMYKIACSLKLNNKWGLLDCKGNVIFDFIYDNEILLEQHFEQTDVISVRVDGRFMLYNSKWRQLTNKSYDKLSFVCGGIVYCENETFGIMDYYGNIKHEGYENIFCFIKTYKDLLVCKKNKLYGIINTNGEIVIKCIFDELSWFSKSGKYICAKRPGCPKWGVLDVPNKKIILDFKYDKIEFCTSCDSCEYVLTELDGESILYKFDNINKT